MRVVLLASGWEMMAKVRRGAILPGQWATETSLYFDPSSAERALRSHAALPVSDVQG